MGHKIVDSGTLNVRPTREINVKGPKKFCGQCKPALEVVQSMGAQLRKAVQSMYGETLKTSTFNIEQTL